MSLLREHRRLTDAELQELETFFRRELDDWRRAEEEQRRHWHARRWVRRAFWLLVLLALYVGLARHWLWLSAIAAALLGLKAASYVRRREDPDWDRMLSGRMEVFCEAEVDVWQVEALGLVEFEQFEDEGALWVMDVGDGQLLVLAGQEYDATDEFPSTRFLLVRGPNTAWVVPRGQPLDSARSTTRHHQTREPYDDAYERREFVIAGTLATAEEDLRRALETAP